MSNSKNSKRTYASSPHVECVPLNVSFMLVAAQSLAKRLAEVASELAGLSLEDVEQIGFKKLDLLDKIDECTYTTTTLIEETVVNMSSLFDSLASSQRLHGESIEVAASPKTNPDRANALDVVDRFEARLQQAQAEVNGSALAIGLVTSDYCVDGTIRPDLLLDACFLRLSDLEKRLRNNYDESVELSMQVHRDTICGAVAATLVHVCEFSLQNQISLEPIPQQQEDVLVALSTYVDLPFSGVWPLIKEAADGRDGKDIPQLGLEPGLDPTSTESVNASATTISLGGKQ